MYSVGGTKDQSKERSIDSSISGADFRRLVWAGFDDQFIDKYWVYICTKLSVYRREPQKHSLGALIFKGLKRKSSLR